MAEDGTLRQPAQQAAGMRPQLTAGEGPRRAWARPAMQRFSLQRTLAGSSTHSDVSKPLDAFAS